MPVETQTGSVQAAVWTTAYVDSLPTSSFAWVDSKGQRHLPYKDKDGKVDLPHTRNALARLNQVQGMSDEERAKVRTKLQNALKNAKAADDMVLRTTHAVQASAGDTATLPDRVHLLRAGSFNTQKYGEVPIAASDLFEMKFNFERGVGMADEGQTGIPIDFAHQSHLEAAGWIHSLEVLQTEDGGTELWGNNVEWSDSGRDALVGKKYKCLSSDFYPAAFGEWVDPESGVSAKNVIVGAALTNRPLMTGNKPVIASEVDGEVEAEAAEEAEAIGVKTVIYVNASETIKEKRMNLDQLRVKASEELTGPEALFIAQHVSELSEDERKKFGLEAAAKKPTDTEMPNADDEGQVQKLKAKKEDIKAGEEGTVSIQAADLKAIQETMATLASERKTDKETIASLQASISKLEDTNKSFEASAQAADREKMHEVVMSAIKRGAIKPDREESYTNRLVAAQGEDRQALIADIEALASNDLLSKQFGSQQTEGSAAMDVEAEIIKKANEVVKAAHARGEKMNIFQAREEVLASDPELKDRADKAVLASAPSFNPFEAGSWGAGAKGLQGVNPDVTK